MNDERYLYLGAALPDAEGDVPDNPPYYDLFMVFAFEDEPAGEPAAWVDCAWEAQSCNAPEDEGWLFGEERQYPDDSFSGVSFDHWAGPHQNCGDGTAAKGVAFDAAPRGALRDESGPGELPVEQP